MPYKSKVHCVLQLLINHCAFYLAAKLCASGMKRFDMGQTFRELSC